MSTKYFYTVYPEDQAKITNIADMDYPLPQGEFYAIVSWGSLISGIIGLICIFIGGYMWIVFGGISTVCVILQNNMIKEARFEFRQFKAKEEAEILSTQLNKILIKSEEIINNILPYFESSAHRSLEIAKVDFEENALSPFWDKIEESSKSLAFFKEAIDQLQTNGEIYSKILEQRSHNFPIPFPLGIEITISQDLLKDYNATIRNAQKKFEFANIWEHRKTQKILIAGFTTLEQAINNMAETIVAAIHALKHSIRSDFRELKNIQIDQIRIFDQKNRALNNTLSSMDTKLYFMQYNKHPNTPFTRPVSDY